jgi:hypothetical protein
MRTIKEICTQVNLPEWQAKAESAYEHGITPEIAHSIIEHYLELCTLLQANCENLTCQLEIEPPALVQLD